MLDAVYQKWTNQHAATRTNGGVRLVAPVYFYPTYDPMQTDAFRNMCEPANVERAAEERVGSNPALVAAHLRVCASLGARAYSNGAAAGAYAVHHWAHTWIGGAEKVDLTDTVDIE